MGILRSNLSWPPLFLFLSLLIIFANAADSGKNNSSKNDADQIKQELGDGGMASSSSSSSNSSSSGKSSSSSSSTTTQTVGGKGNKKKVVTKTVVTEVEEEETEAEKREKAAARERADKKEQNNSLAEMRDALFANNWKELLAKETAEREEHQRNEQAQMGRMNALGAAFLDTQNGHINLKQDATDPFAACIDELPVQTCAILKPLCAVSDTARAIRFLRERSDYILYLGEDLQKHIDFVKSTAPNSIDAFYAATLLQNLENIKSLLPSVTKTAPLIQMILDEDLEEELEHILDAHLHFKQQCEGHRGTCKRMDIASLEREKSCRIYEEQCCCDGLKFEDFYRGIQKADGGKQCEKAKALGKSVRRMVEAACAQTCGSCPTRFKLNQYADELVECERDRKLPKLAELHVHVHPRVQMPIGNELVDAGEILEYQELMGQLEHSMLLPKQRPLQQPPISPPTLDIQVENVQLPSVPLNVQSAAIRQSHPNVNLLAQLLSKQSAPKKGTLAAMMGGGANANNELVFI